MRFVLFSSEVTFLLQLQSKRRGEREAARPFLMSSIDLSLEFQFRPSWLLGSLASARPLTPLLIHASA